MPNLNSPFMIAVQRELREDGNAYEIKTRKDGARLGTIQWYERWHCYEFLPTAGTGFDAKCLAALANFCAELTRERTNGGR